MKAAGFFGLQNFRVGQDSRHFFCGGVKGCGVGGRGGRSMSKLQLQQAQPLCADLIVRSECKFRAN